jgi:hypothetical protein
MGWLIVSGGGVRAFSQQETRASLGGKVTDPQGGAIAKASVVVTSDETGVVEKTQTNDTGDWMVKFLSPGAYRFSVSVPGFKRTEHSAIQLAVADQKLIDTQLQLGGQTEFVNVEATTPLVDTTSAATGTVVQNAEIQELPSASNSPTMMVALTPGAIISGGVGGTGIYLWSNGGLSGTTVNGSGSGSAAINFTIDGAIDNISTGNIAFEPPADAVSEFRVVTNAYDAAIGRQTAATINLAMKSGSERFHGDLYEYNYTNFLNANYFQNNLTATPVPLVHNNQYGGSAGGPVWIPKLYNGKKKKTFFFFTYAGIRNLQPASTGYMSIPTMLERTGDFSQSFTTATVNGVVTKYPTQIYDPLSIDQTSGNRTLFPGNAIPASRISPIGTALLKFLPPPDNAGDGANSDSNNYVKRETQNDKFSGYTWRFDQNWNNANNSYVTLRYNTWNELSYDPFGPQNIFNGIYQKRVNYGSTADHNIVLSPTLLLDLRYNLTRWDGSSYSSSAGVNPTTVGFSQSFAALQQLPSIPEIQGIVTGAENGGLGTAQAGSITNDTSHDFNVAMSQTHKNHIFRYGFEYLIQQNGGKGLGDSGGLFNFGNNWTTQNPNTTAGTGVGNDVADLVLGLPTSGNLPTAAQPFWSQRYTAVFFQDDWRVSRKLTLNLGMRWDYERPVTERYNSDYNRFDPNLIIPQVTAPSQAAYASEIAGAAANTGIALLQQFRGDPTTFITRGGVLYAGLNGTSDYDMNPRYKYFQPRIGFAYQLLPNLILRGGLGRFAQSSFVTGSQSGFSASTPFIATTNNYYTVSANLANPFPTGLVPVTGNSLGVLTNVGSTSSFTDPNNGRVYTDQASLYVQRQFGQFLIEVGGTLNMTHGLAVTDPFNGNNTGYNINMPSEAAWLAANTPTFDSTGRPVDTLAGNVQVANPFKGAPYITNGEQSNSTIAAYQLLRPNPVVGNILLNHANGQDQYYALNTKVEKRFGKGFSIIQSFVWSKRMQQDTFAAPQYISQRLLRQLDPADQRFHYTLAPVYELPFGKGKRFGANSGKLLNALIGGYEVTGLYTFISGTPLTLPTNSAFFEGVNPSVGNPTPQRWFNTSMFEPFPSRSLTVAQLLAYPSWTGVASLPGYSYVPTSSSDATKNGVYQDFATWGTSNDTTFGNIRNPYTNNFDLAIRKSFQFTETIRLQLRMDAFNSLNHPRFGNIDTNPSDAYFGWLNGSSKLSQVNAPRQIQLGARLIF